jgi:hypothetical protein
VTDLPSYIAAIAHIEHFTVAENLDSNTFKGKNYTSCRSHLFN